MPMRSSSRTPGRRGLSRRLDQHLGAGAVARGEQHRAAGARQHARQCAAPGACSDDGDVLEGHVAVEALSAAARVAVLWRRSRPRRVARAGAAVRGRRASFHVLSGQRACGAVASVSVRPSARRSAPAQAIMAPLSVHKRRRRHHQHGAGLERDVMQHLADRLIGGDAAGGDQRGRLAVALAEQLQARRAAGRRPPRRSIAGTRRRDRARPRGRAARSSPPRPAARS